MTPNSDPSADNPFSTRYTRPGAIPFRFPPGTSADGLVEQLRRQQWRGAIVGPHGSGKSSLVAALVPPLRLPAAAGTGFRIRDYSVSFTGLCPACSKKKS